MRLSQSTIDQVRNVSILDLAYNLGDQPKRVGNSYEVYCPNRNHITKRPHTYINPVKNIWKCFGGGGCGAKGADAITYYAWHEFGDWNPKLHFVDAIVGIAELMGITVEYEGNLSQPFHKPNQNKSILITQNKPVFEEIKAQDPDTCDYVYRKFLDLCPIYREHAEEWLGPKRQYNKKQILNIGLRSVPRTFEEQFTILNKLKDQGIAFDRIPGFTQVLKKDGIPENENHWYWTINARKGYFIPVRDEYGRIVRLRVATMGKPKYIWFSSNPSVYFKDGKYHFYDVILNKERDKNLNLMIKGGAPSGAPINIVPPAQILSIWNAGDDITSIYNIDEVIVTEGEHKSYISASILKKLIIGVPGVGNWRDVIPLLNRWGIKKIAIAYDMDALKSTTKANGKNQQVFDHLVEFANEALQHDIEVVLITWNLSDGKGLDDVLLSGKIPTEINIRTNERQPLQIL